MKSSMITLVVFCLISAIVQATEKEIISSKIIHATVYPEWAYVTRKAQVTLTPGSRMLAISNSLHRVYLMIS